MKFKLGLIGAGNIARAHVAAIESISSAGPGSFSGQVSGLKITAVVDPVESARTTLAGDVAARAFADVGQMLTDVPVEERPDALIVCTPPSARIDVVRQALAAGLPVLIEKPPAHTIADVQQLIALSVDRPDLPCLVGFCHRFTPAVDRMIELCNHGTIGPVVRFENTFAANLPHLRDAWMSDPKLSGGGSLIDTGLHSIDLFGYLFGPAQVEGAVLRHGWDGRGESNATVLLSSTSDRGRIVGPAGVAGTIASGWEEASRFEVRLVGTLGTLRYDFDDPCVLHHTATDGTQQTIEVETHEVRFARQLQAFVSLCLKQDGQPPVCTVAQSLDAMRLVHDATTRADGEAGSPVDVGLVPQIVQRQPASAKPGKAVAR